MRLVDSGSVLPHSIQDVDVDYLTGPNLNRSVAAEIRRLRMENEFLKKPHSQSKGQRNSAVEGR